MVTDLHEQDSPRPEKVACSEEDPAHEMQAVIPAGQREPGLMPVFGWQSSHGSGVDIRRIGNDEVVAFVRQPAEQVGPGELHTPAEAVSADIAACDRECGARDVGCVYRSSRELKREHNGEAAGTGAQLKHAAHSRWAGDPRVQPVKQQLGQVGARNDRAPVDVEAAVSQPGFLDQIGKRLAGAYARFDQSRRPASLEAGKLVGGRPREIRMGKAQNMREEPGGFFFRAVRAVPESQLGAPESPLGVLEPVTQPGWLRALDRTAEAGALQGESSRRNARK